jgi:hypothetical protein
MQGTPLWSRQLCRGLPDETAGAPDRTPDRLRRGAVGSAGCCTYCPTPDKPDKTLGFSGKTGSRWGCVGTFVGRTRTGAVIVAVRVRGGFVGFVGRRAQDAATRPGPATVLATRVVRLPGSEPSGVQLLEGSFGVLRASSHDSPANGRQPRSLQGSYLLVL